MSHRSFYIGYGFIFLFLGVKHNIAVICDTVCDPSPFPLFYSILFHSVYAKVPEFLFLVILISQFKIRCVRCMKSFIGRMGIFYKSNQWQVTMHAQ